MLLCYNLKNGLANIIWNKVQEISVLSSYFSSIQEQNPFFHLLPTFPHIFQDPTIIKLQTQHRQTSILLPNESHRTFTSILRIREEYVQSRSQGRELVKYLIIIMFPFNSSLANQYISQLYASSAFYSNSYYFMPEESGIYWNPVKYTDMGQPSIISTNIEPKLEKQEIATAPTETTVKIAEEQDQEASAAQEWQEEESEKSPEIRSRQKYGRNINSNIFHHMLKKIQTEKHYESIVEKVVKRNDLTITTTQFRDILTRKIPKLSTYLSLKKMKNVLQGIYHKNRMSAQNMKKQKQFCKILRILCRMYLKFQHPAQCFNVLKIRHNSKRFHISSCRNILALMS